MTEQEFEREIELDHIRLVQRTRESSALQFDKLIVYLNGGFIALSVSLVHSFYMENVGINSLVITSWLSSIISLLLNLISHITTVKSMDYYLENKKNKSKCIDSITYFLNYLCLILLVTALVLFLIYMVR